MSNRELPTIHPPRQSEEHLVAATPATEIPGTLLECLRDRARCVRRVAVRRLVDYGPAAVEPLRHALGDRDRGVRVAAVRVLARNAAGPEGVDLLCRALQDRDRTVRKEAIEAVGEVGDERAVQPLVAALRRGPSARCNLAFSILALLGLIVFLTRSFTSLPAMDLAVVRLGTLGLWLIYLVTWVTRSSQSDNSRRIAGALERIAERSPSLRFHEAVRELKLVAADLMQQEAQARKASWGAAKRIERLTADQRSLPVPSAAPEASPETLPRPSAEPGQRADNLPRVVPDTGRTPSG